MERLASGLPPWVDWKTATRCAPYTASFAFVFTVGGLGLSFSELPYRRAVLQAVSASMLVVGVLCFLITAVLCVAWRLHFRGRPSVLVIRVPTISADLLAANEAPPPPYDVVVPPPPSYEDVVKVMSPEKGAVDTPSLTSGAEGAQRF
ncbi:hypothetical protein HPB47_012514 [Ixodes persulcatus]|uniref:Uncharacterized protein n=1 Tax=Ixodes persulcatus TaxID=34615 RepID=A0AC60NTG0_IXOPE|nr:hypothetical protein HPB47_012514 [Ixodes persulcatus]